MAVPQWENIPAALTERQQWVLWMYQERDGGKRTKVPYATSGRQASSTDPATWTTFARVRVAFERTPNTFDGIGFVLSPADPIVGVDLDHCLNPEHERLDLLEDWIITSLRTYTEITPSGVGLRCFLIAPDGLPAGGRKRGPVEMYDSGRFLTVTGNIFANYLNVEQRQEEIAAVHRHVFGEPTPPPAPRQATAISDLSLSDQELLTRAFAAKNGDQFRSLFQGAWQHMYPSQSEADSALAWHLSFWTGGDTERMDSLFRQSGLLREKWDKPHYGDGRTYGRGVLDRAAAGVTEEFAATIDLAGNTGGFGGFVNVVNATEYPKPNSIDTLSLSGDIADGSPSPVPNVPTAGHRPPPRTSGSVDNVDKTAKTSPESESWPALIPLGTYDLPVFPVDALPAWLQDFVCAISEATQTPPDLAGMLSLSAIATTVARRVLISPRPGWVEPLNLYTATFLAPGNRKTAVLRAVTRPLADRESIERHDAVINAAKLDTAKRVLEAQRVEAERKASRISDHIERANALTEAQNIAAELATLAPRSDYRLFTEDCTPEKLVQLLAENDGRIAVLTDEGDTWDLMAGRYNDKANLGVYLKAFSGESLLVDRIGRKGERVENPALTIGMAVQPDILRGLLSKPTLRGRGLLGRFLYSLPQERLGYRNVDAAPVPVNISSMYHGAITTLLDLPLSTATPDMISLAPEAAAVLKEYERGIELQLRPGEILGDMTDWGGKLLGQVMRICALLHIAGHACPAAPLFLEVPAATALSAIRIGGYLAAHARAAFGEMGADEEQDQARLIVDWARQRDIREITQRDLYRALARRFKRPEDMAAPLTLLVARNHVREIQRPSNAKGGRPSVSIEFHPDLFIVEGRR